MGIQIFFLLYNLYLSSGYFGTKTHIYINTTIKNHCFSKNKIFKILSRTQHNYSYTVFYTLKAVSIERHLDL